jgi:hypothetical protein
MNIVAALKLTTARVTRKWTKQRKREERNAAAHYRRREHMTSDRIDQKSVAWEVIPQAYAKASDNGKYPAHARQIFYAARPEIQAETGRMLESVYFTQTLLPMYVNDHPEAADWWIVYDARGRLMEPHTEKQVPLGTLEVAAYLKSIGAPASGALDFRSLFDTSFPTAGPRNRISAILFIEKEGFNELFRAARLAERYDIAIMSSKGQSVVAARRLVDELCGQDGGVPLLVLHDFDKAGLEIAQNLTSVSQAAIDQGRVRYRFQNEIQVIDLGVRLEDVEQWNLESERVRFKRDFGPDSLATTDEQKFLRSNRRVELNAFTSPDFMKFIEAKLAAHGVKKVVPDGELLADAYRRAYQIQYINRQIETFRQAATQLAEAAPVPKDLRRRILARFTRSPAKSWDDIVAEIAAEAVATDGK